MTNLNIFNRLSLLLWSGLLIGILITTACESNVLFKDAMPPGIARLKTIPLSYQGQFLCESDSSIIISKEESIVREAYVKFYAYLKQIKETEGCSIKDGSLYMPWSEECIPFEYVNDSLITAKMHKIDTLFHFRKGEVAKLYKGRLFLNVQVKNSKNWLTSMVSQKEDGTIYWERIHMPDEIEKVEAITPNFTTKKSRENKTVYIMNPTLVEFDKILEKNYVRECDVFTPIYYPKQEAIYYE